MLHNTSCGQFVTELTHKEVILSLLLLAAIIVTIGFIYLLIQLHFQYKNKKAFMKTEQLKHLFASYPDQQELYYTSDGSCYLIQSSAIEYAERAKLDDKTIEVITRAEIEAMPNKKAASPEMKKVIVTEEDLTNNPDLVEAGIKVGDEIEVEDTAAPVPPKAATPKKVTAPKETAKGKQPK